MKGDVRFNLQLVFLCWLKYAVLLAFLVFQDLAVEKPERRGWKSVHQRKKSGGVGGEKGVCVWEWKTLTDYDMMSDVPDKAPPGDDFSVTVVDSVPFETQLFPFNTAIP